MRKRDKPAIYGGPPMFAETIPITKPTMPPFSALKQKYIQVLKSGLLTNSKNVQEFEKRVASYLNVKHAVATNSCTNGLMLIIKALGLTGEIILPSFTFHATAHAIVWNGLKPVFVDCDLETYNICAKEAEKAITTKTSAILAVHVFGNPADVESLQKLADKHGLKLLFDAAHGFGAKRKGKNIGGFGLAESFSLSPTKLLTSGEGGIVATNNDELAEKIRIGRNYGDPGTYDCDFSGFNARMNEFSAVLGLEGLKMIEKNVIRRNRMVRLFKKHLSRLPGISFQEIDCADRSSFKDFSILIDKNKFGLSRDELQAALIKENIIVKKYFYPPVHLQMLFCSDLKRENNNFPNTMKISLNSLSLPLYSHISERTVQKICRAIERIWQYRKGLLCQP